MKILYLGTGACEGTPSMYCVCPVCEYARKRKGKELRTRTSFVIDDKLFIDFSPDTYTNTVKHNIVFGKIERLLISHCDADHFYADDLVMRFLNDNHQGIPQKLNIYGNEMVEKKFKSVPSYSNENLKFVNLVFLEQNKTVLIDGYSVTPFYTKHLLNENCYVYLIQKNGKSYLHLVDSPIPEQKVFDFLVENNVKLDCVSMDCTFGSSLTEYGGHMTLLQNVKVKEKLTQLGVADKSTKFIATHISHYTGCDTYKSLKKLAKRYGITLSFDGMKVEF